MSTKDYSSKQESTIARYFDWNTVVGSGARDFHYGDIISMDWLGECKTHTKPQDKITFFRKHWKKISEEALFHHRNPVLIVDNGTQNPSSTFCMFKYTFDSLENYTISSLEFDGTNVILKVSDIESGKIYKISKFDDFSAVYISRADTFKELLENC